MALLVDEDDVLFKDVLFDVELFADAELLVVEELLDEKEFLWKCLNRDGIIERTI